MTTNTPHERGELERKIIRHLLNTALAAGWTVEAVDDGGFDDVRCTNIDEVLDAVFSVDDSTIMFNKTIDGKTLYKGVKIVLGNGIHCIADNSVHPLFEAEVIAPSEAFVEWLESMGEGG